MGADKKYDYILPELTTEEYYLMMFALHKCKNNISYGFRIRPLIEKIQARSMVSAFDLQRKEPDHE